MSRCFVNDTRDIYLASCLYDCIEDNNIQAITTLLDNNEANPNIIIPNRGITPFHLAVGCGFEQTAEVITNLLLRYGGNPNIRSEEKLTPVHVAAAWGRMNILNMLVTCGGDLTLKDDEGKTPLDYAVLGNHSSIISYLQHVENNFEQKSKLNEETCDLELESVNLDNSCLKNGHDEHTDIENVDKIFLSDDPLEQTYTILKDSDLEDSFVKINVSRESGILTIPSESFDSLKSSNTEDNKSNVNLTKEEEAIKSQSSQYLTCDSENNFEKNICSSLITSDESNILNKNIVDSLLSLDLSRELANHKNCEDNTSDNVSIIEEYKYVDENEKVVLIEERHLVNPVIENKYQTSSSSSTVIDIDTDTLKQELTSLGEPPGPITITTKKVYLKKLKRLKRSPETRIIVNSNSNRTYSVELEKTLRNSNWINDLASYAALEQVVVDQFSNPNPTKRWREGLTKTSFTYLLLDPRITNNLPYRFDKLDSVESWRTFLSAIFYVGKGKRSRPYAHLYEAISHWNKNTLSTKKKVDHILSIWKNQCGVVCLHIFQNVIPVEAYTREAAMINALKLQNLCNSKSGDFYGICATWPERQKRLLGVYLLYRAMLIFLNEGERQLRPNDID